MTPAEATRPVLIARTLIGAVAIAAALSGCGAVDGDTHRFRSMADHVAAIDVPLDPGARQTGRSDHSAQADGLRPARFAPVRVAVMDPHAMWDARDDQAGVRRVAADAGLREAVIRIVQPKVQAGSPVVGGDPTSTPEPAVLHDAGLRPAASVQGRTIQLGAYSSPMAAEQAWARLKASSDMAALTPRFEQVQVQGRALTRLKVGPVPAETAAALCRSANVADAWCARNS